MQPKIRRAIGLYAVMSAYGITYPGSKRPWAREGGAIGYRACDSSQVPTWAPKVLATSVELWVWGIPRRSAQNDILRVDYSGGAGACPAGTLAADFRVYVFTFSIWFGKGPTYPISQDYHKMIPIQYLREIPKVLNLGCIDPRHQIFED